MLFSDLGYTKDLVLKSELRRKYEISSLTCIIIDGTCPTENYLHQLTNMAPNSLVRLFFVFGTRWPFYLASFFLKLEVGYGALEVRNHMRSSYTHSESLHGNIRSVKYTLRDLP